MVSQYGSLDITWPTIFKLALAAFGLYVIFLIKDILVWVLFALVISVVFDPVIDFLCKRRIPRTLAAVLVYSMLFAFLAFTIYSSAPFFLKEIQRFSALFPQYFETLAPPLQGIGITAFSDFQSFLDA
ncbi:MAG: AI-2E family transporter, partial [Candidatus Pacearchaeota archaeon]|nr:AI-2E family transporter [Candidatus Pacearchaeota archaeon]